MLARAAPYDDATPILICMPAKSRLSRVYFNGQPVTLMGDEAAPPLSRIIRAGGKAPQDIDVLYLTSPADPVGHIVGAEEIIDRMAEPTRPIYLRSVPKGSRKPIHTAMSGNDWPSPVVHSVPPPGGPGHRNVDPVIAQLGRDPRHQPGVFKAPSDLPLPVPDKAQAKRKASNAAKATKASANAKAQADAEEQAEDRQESERNQEDLLSDEREAAEDADDDLKLQGRQGAGSAPASDE
jgi:hypothetical protein